jgi:Ser/Thr protein kinase RdoA (MazF antagonist)
VVRVVKAAAVVVAVPVAVLAVCPPVAVALAWAVDRPWAVDLADAVVDRRGPGDLVVDLRAAVAAGFREVDHLVAEEHAAVEDLGAVFRRAGYREVDAAVEFRVAAVLLAVEHQAASAAEREAVGLAELPAEACRGAVAAVRAAELP